MTAQTTYSDIYEFITEKSRELGGVSLIEVERDSIKEAIQTVEANVSIDREQLAKDLAFFKSEVNRVQQLFKDDEEEASGEARIMLLGFWFSLSVTVMSELERADQNGAVESLAESLRATTFPGK